VTVDLYVPSKVKAVAHAKTNRKGQYTFKTRKIKKKTRFLVEVIFIRALPACPAPPLPTVPQGCGGATTSAYAAAIVTGRKRR
jgi:hypothetical protein